MRSLVVGCAFALTSFSSFALMSSAAAAWLSSGGALPGGSPTLGAWHKIQFSYTTPAQPWQIDARLRSTTSGATFPTFGGPADATAIAHSLNGDAIYASTLGASIDLLLVRYDPALPYFTVPFDLTPYATSDPLTIAWGTYTPGPTAVGSIAALVNGQPQTLPAIAVPEPGCAGMMLVGLLACASKRRQPKHVATGSAHASR